MDAATQKIWQAVTSLEQADIHSTALCNSIIKLIIDQGVAAWPQGKIQIGKS